MAGAGQLAIGCWWAMQFTAAGYVALVLIEAASIGLACALCPAGRGRHVALPGLLVGAEWLRETWPFGGLPLGGLPLGQADGPLLDMARVGGPLLVMAGAVVIACGASALVEAKITTGLLHVAVVLALALLASVAPDGGPGVRDISVVAVQGGGQRGLSALDVSPASVLAAQIAATSTVQRRTQLIVWPEDAVALDQGLRASGIEPYLGAVARRLRATFVVGVTIDVGTSSFLNEAAVFGPSGRYLTSFEKVHAVPFGEYVPWRSLFAHFASLNAVPRDAIVGHGSGMVETPAGRLALLVSYETFFAGRARSGVRAGGEVLVVPTNTASYRDSQVPLQELAASRLQAVSEGRDLVQVATTGYSGFINPDGDPTALSGLGTRQVLRATVPLRTGRTVYERFGDLPVLILALIAAMAGWFLDRGELLSRRRERLLPAQA